MDIYAKNRYKWRVRITKKDRDYLNKVKGKKSMAAKLEEIIKEYAGNSRAIKTETPED